MTSVLASPVDFRISDERYGKSYNILNNLQSDEFEIEAYTAEVETPVTCDNVSLRPFHSESKIEYLTDSYKEAYGQLRSGNVDIYHHMNLGYRWFNPILVAGLADEVPTIIGPAQGGHDILKEEFYHLVNHASRLSVPRPVTDPLYRIIQRTRSTLIDPPRLQLYRRTLREADKVIAVHQEAKDLLSEFVDRSNIDIIPLGVDVSEFTFSERKQTTDLVAIGVLKQRKGYDILLNAVAQVCEVYPNVQLHVFGEGPRKSALEGLAKSNGISNNVTFHGYVDQSVLQEYLANARAFVHPSRSESFSLVRLEAMATGTPAIVSNTSGAREMVRDGTDGFVVPIESTDELADAIERVLSDFDLTKRMGYNARDHVEEEYDWAKIGQQYIEAYRSLI
jgi:glycosyltransferase involved in cell wall biosynthesis